MDLVGTQSIHIQISEYHLQHLQRALDNLPKAIKVQVLARALKRVTDTTRSRIIERSAERLSVAPGQVRSRTTATFNAGGNTQEIIIKSGWIPLYALGARQDRYGVKVKLRGSYQHAFLARMDSGHRGVFRRVPGTRMAQKNKEQIRELFGPNPASDVRNNPEAYEEVLAGVIEDVLVPRTLHELERVLPGR